MIFSPSSRPSNSLQSRPRKSGGRDFRIDFFRGIALLCIFVDHIPGNFVSRLTLHNLGFSDAAELFVLLDGVSAALAYGNRSNATGLIFHRVSRIYAAHITLVFFIALLLATAGAISGNEVLLDHPTLQPFRTDLPAAISNTLILGLLPEYIDILPLYLMLLIWLPALLHLAKWWPASALAVAMCIWLLTSTFHLNFGGSRAGGWFFNPFAWQLLFSIGVIIGLRQLTLTDEASLPRARTMLFLALAFLLFSFVLSAPWRQLPVLAWRHFHILPIDLVGPVSKTYASAWRIVHVLCLAYVAAWWVPRDAGWLASPWATAIRELGRRPLTMFMLASVSSYVAGIVFVLYGKGLGVQIACNLVGLAVLAAVGNARRFVHPAMDRMLVLIGRDRPGHGHRRTAGSAP